MRFIAVLIALLLASLACSSDDPNRSQTDDTSKADVGVFSCECEVAFVTDMGEDIVICDPSPAGTWVPEADSLCQDNDPTTGNGQPDEPGCPNTCSCDCVEGKCFLGACTKIGGCETCPVFR